MFLIRARKTLLIGVCCANIRGLPNLVQTFVHEYLGRVNDAVTMSFDRSLKLTRALQ